MQQEIRDFEKKKKGIVKILKMKRERELGFRKEELRGAVQVVDKIRKSML